ncbi:hypothetical protein HOI04_04375, partial [archaeon]|nr:hypothetical protein [archaeon]
CDGKLRCDDQICAWAGNGDPWGYCSAASLPAGFCGDGIVQTPNAYGQSEECDVNINLLDEANWGGDNPCSGGTCIMPTISGTQGCVCATAPLPQSPPTPELDSRTVIQKIYDKIKSFTGQISSTGNDIKETSDANSEGKNSEPTTTSSSTSPNTAEVKSRR